MPSCILVKREPTRSAHLVGIHLIGLKGWISIDTSLQLGTLKEDNFDEIEKDLCQVLEEADWQVP